MAAAAAMIDDGLPPFEPIDFDDLHELLAGAAAGSQDDPVSAALELGVQETKRVAASVDARLEELEEESVGDYVASFHHFEALHSEIQETDRILEKMEKMLGTFQCDLSSISDEIRLLQSDSLQMNMKLRNRRALQSLMSEYVNSIIVSPTLVRQISDEEINESYLEYLKELNKKLDHVKQQEMQRLPSCAQSKPQLENLRTKAVSRIKDFLLSKINTLKKPKTNLQILQRNVLVKFKYCTQFLAEHHPAVAREVQQHYVETMSAQYLKQFKTYVTGLQKLELEYAPTEADLLVSGGWQSAGVARGLFNNLMGAPVNLSSKGNVFSLSGRDAILEALERDPIIAHTHRENKVKFYHEQLFRSHQMLLMDTATSEFLFLNDFFDTRGDHGLFKEVFGKTMQFFTDALQNYLETCWDSVGLLLMSRIVEHYRRCMHNRQVSCLDDYFDGQQLMIRPRLQVVLKAHVQSLRVACHQKLPPAANTHPTHPHLVMRRYAELAASLFALSPPEAGGLSDDLQHPLMAMQQEACALCKAIASKLEGPDSGLVFLVNNYDLVLSVFLERHLPRTATDGFAELRQEQVQLFVESQLNRHFPELTTFVKDTEDHVAHIDEGARGQHAHHGPPPGVDVVRMEQVVRIFAQSWRRETERINQFVRTSFTNFENGSEILKQVLTQMVLYYTRLQKIMRKTFLNQDPAFAHELVPTTTILKEIQQYSRSF